MAKTGIDMTAFGPGWEERLLRDLADECIAEANAEEPIPAIPAQATHSHNWMTPKEVCTEYPVQPRTLQRYLKARKLAYYKTDQKLYFKRAEVEAFFEKRHLRAK
jgi:hypothetical protein